VLTHLSCPASAELPCRLSGTNLPLLAAVAGDPEFTHAVEVPGGFPDGALPVPHPAAGRLYVRLRDDPAVNHPAAIAVDAPPQAPAAAGHARNAAGEPG
jgi:hypothetical protein